LAIDRTLSFGPAAGVVNVMSAPLVVPSAFVATTRKWYVVLGWSPTTSSDTDLPPGPPPVTVASGDREPYAVVVPHSKW
jgi:hypothetical protein